MIAAMRNPGISTFKPERAGCRHHQQIAKVGMPGATEMRMTESKDGAVVVLIASAILVNIRIVFPFNKHRGIVCFGAELYTPEWHSSSWKRMSHVFCADKRIDVFDEGIGRLLGDH